MLIENWIAIACGVVGLLNKQVLLSKVWCVRACVFNWKNG